ncbi:hypothetical protein HanPI659440_Chr11g0428811 [Helianthus annuus]|nr:hypothetical protein HanPI659440_Chr11g0428811 [Helianthus annuus]
MLIISAKFPSHMMISLLSLAFSELRLPIAIPMSAPINAGTSSVLCPRKTTTSPLFLKASTRSDLSDENASPRTRILSTISRLSSSVHFLKSSPERTECCGSSLAA